MQRFIRWQKLEKYIYKQVECSDKSMDTLCIFLNDGIGFKPYIDFLENAQKIRIGGNLSYLEKQGKMVSIEIDDYVYPDMPSFITTIDNLLTILKEYKRLFYLEVDIIEITIEDDELSIKGE